MEIVSLVREIDGKPSISAHYKAMIDYVRQHIVFPLIRALDDTRPLGVGQSEFRDRLVDAIEYADGDWFAADGENLLQGFYQHYLFCHTVIHGYDKWAAREAICLAITLDYEFEEWVLDEKKLIRSVDAWASYHKEKCSRSDEYPLLLKAMSEVLYDHGCDSVDIDELRSILVREKKEGNAYSREVYCMFHAFATIWQHDGLGIVYKKVLFALVVQHWDFMRALYSAMLQRVVGYGYLELAAVIHNAKTQVYRPFAHLLYAAVEEHRERIIRSGTKAYNLDRAMKALREVVVHTEPSAELDEVVGIIFSDRLKEYLEHHQPKSYRELETELHTLRSGMDERTRQIQALMAEQAEMLRQMAETSVSIEVITEELLRLPAGTAYGVYEKLNALLQKDEVWRNHADNIRDRVLEHERNYHNQLYFNAPVGTVVAHADRVIGKDEN